jgi:hypothetical protein
MSIQKMSDISRVEVETNPFTQITNSVILGIKDNDAFRLYCWLASKTRDWNVVKEYAAKECGIGERKSVKIWSYFARSGLIQYVQKFDEHGKFRGTDMVVTLGLNFNEKEPFLAPKKLSTEKRKTACAETACASTAPAEMSVLLNKETLNKDLQKKALKSSCTQLPKKQTAKTKKDWNNEAKHHWASKAKVCEPVTKDPVICGNCRRPENHCGCYGEPAPRLPREIAQAFSREALARLGRKSTQH